MIHKHYSMAERCESASGKGGARAALLTLLGSTIALSGCGADAQAKDGQAPIKTASAERVVNRTPIPEQTNVLPASFGSNPALEKLGDEVVLKIVGDYRTCIGENIAFVAELDDPQDKADMTEYGEEACKESMGSAIYIAQGEAHIAQNKADMRAMTDALIAQAKSKQGT